MALQGTLEDFGIADIFQLIGQQQKTGVLVLTRKEMVVHIHFNEGNIISAEVQNRDKAERLGQMMVEAGLITPDKLQSALEQQKKTLEKLGTILVENHAIKKSELDEFIYLQTKETIFKLFRWNSGTYQFHQQDVAAATEFFQPISAEHILMDGFRIIDEWPAIRKKIGSFTTIYEHVPGKRAPLREGKKSDLDGDLDKAFSSFEGGMSSVSEADSLPPNCERIYELVDGKRNVKALVAYSRLGEFEACHALSFLMDNGWLKAGRDGGEDDALAPSAKRSIDLYQDYETTKTRWVQLLPRLVFYLTYGLAFLVFVGYLGFGPLSGFFDTGRQKIQGHFFHEIVSDYETERIRFALDVYYLEKGYYPKDLKELLSATLLKERDLRYPWESDYLYHSDGASYRLEKPFY